MLPQAQPKHVVRLLLKLKGIQRRGRRFVPSAQYVTYKEHPTNALAHGLKALLGLLHTVEHNVATDRASTLFEQTVINPRFPVVELGAFHRRLKSVAGDFVWMLDRDMRRRETRRKGGRRARLGVGVFAFEEPRVTGVKRTGRARPQSRPARGS